MSLAHASTGRLVMQPLSLPVWQGNKTGTAHRVLAAVIADSSVGALFVEQGVWLVDNYYLPSLPERQKVVQAPNYHINLRVFTVWIRFSFIRALHHLQHIVVWC